MVRGIVCIAIELAKVPLNVMYIVTKARFVVGVEDMGIPRRQVTQEQLVNHVIEEALKAERGILKTQERAYMKM